MDSVPRKRRAKGLPARGIRLAGSAWSSPHSTLEEAPGHANGSGTMRFGAHELYGRKENGGF